MRLFLFSFLILFLEFAFIRYIPAHVKATAYFANLTIIATFLGMGLGMLLSGKGRFRGLLPSVPLLVLTLLCCVHFFSNAYIQPFTNSGEFFWPATQIHNIHVRSIGIFWVISIFFILTSACFVPLGHGLGMEFRNYKPLVAYSLDILGSILGIALFGFLSSYCQPPAVWTLCAGAVLVCLNGRNPKMLLWIVWMMGLNAYLVHAEDRGQQVIWSPYYKITTIEREGSERPIFVNDSFHQIMVDMRTELEGRKPFFTRFAEDYHQPYRSVGPREEVLILGAGTGNDVAVALQEGARHVDAVEIDPVILSIGDKHPNAPYQDPRVTRHVTDARVFLKNCRKKYDLIVYATLDSHTILAGQTNIRLDNYLYTAEALRNINGLLKDNGTFLLQFLALEDYIATKLAGLMEATFEQPPRVLYFPHYRHFNHALLVGKSRPLGPAIGKREPGFQAQPSGDRDHGAAAEHPGQGPSSAQARELTDHTNGAGLEADGSKQASPFIQGSYKLPTDNWPFLYLQKPSVPSHYLRILTMVLAIAAAGVGGLAGRSMLKYFRPAMFFLGAAFLLLETKSITEFSLLFGSTWTVNLFAIMGILIVILLANLLLLRFPGLPRGMLFAGLALSILLCYAIPVRALLAESPLLRDLFTMVFTGLPILFAAGLFASCFQVEKNSSAALGWNLLGAVLGGLLEYSSMIFGIKALYALALALYALAGLSILLEQRRLRIL